MNVRILVIEGDRALRTELDDALVGLTDVSVVIHTTDARTAPETVRTRHPDLILFELTDDFNAVRHLVDDLRLAAPGVMIAAAFRQDLFGTDVSESAFLIEAIRAGVQDFLRRPISSTELGQLIRRIGRPATHDKPTKPGRIISFVSNKGGVGKSTLAVSSACLLARRHPGRVLLIDASLQMGVCASLLNLRPTTTLHDAVQEWDRLDDTLIRRLAAPHSCGLHLLAAPADAEEAAMIDDRVISRVMTLARRAYDYVVVDTFPMLDRVVLAVLDLSDRMNLVVEGIIPTVLGAVQLVKLFDRFGLPMDRQSLILNRFEARSGGPSPNDVASRLGRSVDHVIPYSKKIIIAANIGEPYALRASSWWGFGKAIHRLTDDLEAISTTLAPRAVRTITPIETTPESSEP